MRNAIYATILAGTMVALTQFSMPVYAAMSEADYDAAVKQADAQMKMDKDHCKSLSGNAEDVCKLEAEAAHTRSKALAHASMKGTQAANLEAAEEMAEANYKVAKERCDDFAGNEKDVCVQKAKAVFEKEKVDISVVEKGNTPVARQDANAVKNEADYKVAKEKCDGFAGDAKDACVAQAKAKYRQ